MATASLTLSGPPKAEPRFGRTERTGIRAHFARDVLADMKAAYLADGRPWVAGFSSLCAQAGGKDSTVLAQLPYYILARFRCDVGVRDHDCDAPDQNGDGDVNPR